ncbi:membrane-associated protease RseP (regulator of RpoE activity) [Methanohalophilus levihalophilus]|uniref:site-2 protease family protein n=1 Tax=Methanohalophilus levihalophilus TaxID=1431282 RepID=UPI001AE948D3|nr:site-2 protease family protein [Methanohalophilus levihalophilus]MBP2029725.1 membrane-associated protease RseP (regulator of RpoE activity) [Methanohalophilus levihalophilus]
MTNTTTALAVFFVYWMIVVLLEKRGILAKYNISTYGPILMIRTLRGQGLLNWLARPRNFWKKFADAGIILMFVGMFAMLLVVIVSDIALLSSLTTDSMPEPSSFNEARNIFLIPGVNEFIPLTWGIIALVVTLVVHELAHAVLCRAEDIRVKSMGLLVAIVPIGGFAEPDEDELFGEEEVDEEGNILGRVNPKATQKQRARILAAGVMSNFIVALIAFALLFGPVMGAIAPVGNALVMDVQNGSSAANAGIEGGMIITGINDVQISNVSELIAYTDTLANGSIVTVYASKDRIVEPYEVTVIQTADEIKTGIAINDIVDESPAEAVGLEAGMVILEIDGNPTETPDDFVSYMNTTTAGQEIELLIRTTTSDEPVSYRITLAAHPNPENEKGFLGIFYAPDGIRQTPLGITVGEYPAKEYLELLKSIPSMLTGIAGWIIIFGLPIVGFAGEGFPGFTGALTQLYQPVGWAEPLGVGIFWIANSLLWIGWLNFYVGLFNCMPAVPLDGGHVFRDYLQKFIGGIVRDTEKAKGLSSSIAAGFTILIIMSFAFMIFGPYLVHGF